MLLKPWLMGGHWCQWFMRNLKACESDYSIQGGSHWKKSCRKWGLLWIVQMEHDVQVLPWLVMVAVGRSQTIWRASNGHWVWMVQVSHSYICRTMIRYNISLNVCWCSSIGGKACAVAFTFPTFFYRDYIAQKKVNPLLMSLPLMYTFSFTEFIGKLGLAMMKMLNK